VGLLHVGERVPGRSGAARGAGDLVGEVPGVDPRAVREDGGALDGVRELADVPGQRCRRRSRAASGVNPLTFAPVLRVASRRSAFARGRTSSGLSRSGGIGISMTRRR